MIPFNLTLTFSILLILVFAISGIFLCIRWFAMFVNEGSDIDVGDMKVPTFYATATETVTEFEKFGNRVAFFFCMPVVGVVFGGIHCAGWFFNFPTSAEAILWRVSSAVLTGIAFLLPPLFLLLVAVLDDNLWLITTFFSTILLVYVVSRLLLLVEAFISLRNLTPGMLALVKWTSFIPHI